MYRNLLVIVALISMPALGQDDKPKDERRTTNVQQEESSKPYRIIDRKWTIDRIKAAQKKYGGRAWAEGDILNIVRRSLADSVMLIGSIQAPMRCIDDSDFWTISIEIPGLSRAVIGYAFLEGQSNSLVDEDSWRGVDAPVAVPAPEKLEGKILKEKLWMSGLEEQRDVSVYLPPGHDPKNEHAVIYMADGQGIERYARMIEPLINSGEIPLVMIVGVHSGGYRGERSQPHRMELDFRAIEYLVGADEMLKEPVIDGHFGHHEKFFTETVLDWAERKHGASSKRDQRGIFGVSNSASFCVTMAHCHPELFGFVLPFSFPWKKAAAKDLIGVPMTPRVTISWLACWNQVCTRQRRTTLLCSSPLATQQFFTTGSAVMTH